MMINLMCLGIPEFFFGGRGGEKEMAYGRKE
jgi:hypothetical protein